MSLTYIRLYDGASVDIIKVSVENKVHWLILIS